MSDPQIHPTAIVGESVSLGRGVCIGPYCIIEDDVKLGDNTELMASCTIGRYTSMGCGNRVFPYATVGMEPQDLKFGKERSVLEVGDENVFREHCTMHRGTGHGGGVTKIGSRNLFMAASHVAHDCVVGDDNIFSHAGTLAGHVKVGDHATIGAYSAVHQFCRVGDYAFIGGFSVVTQDALPYVKTVGNRAKIYGINNIGLSRKGFTDQEVTLLKSVYRTLFHRNLRLADALDKIKSESGDSERVRYLISFIEESERGIVR